MEYRSFGRTGWRVSALGFGCGNVGGLMVRGTAADREAAVARAMEMGTNYFDTASAYGDGLSEQHLGQALKALQAKVYVGTKFRLTPPDLADIPRAIERSLEASLRRLGMERVDLFQLHNRITPTRHHDTAELGVQDVLNEVVPTLQRLQQQGKIGFYGITALGDTGAVHDVVNSGAFHSAQVCCNLLNPSAAFDVPAGFPAQNFQRLLTLTQQQEMGVIAIRILAAGALSGVETRHPVAVPSVAPIASGPDYHTDVQRAQAFNILVEEGYVHDLVEASVRFAIGAAGISTILLGYSSLEHLEFTATAVAKGPLPEAAIERLRVLWQQSSTQNQ